MFAAETVATNNFEKFDEILSRRPQAPASSNVLTPYQNFSVLKIINKAKFPVYLAASKIDQQRYAMKVFFYVSDAPHQNFKNEIRFATLKHPNIINTIQHQENIETVQKGEVRKTSYILMEYAPHGDFFDFIMKYKDQIDEKLIRTYFRELIDGIEYLHQNGIAHLDLKPENLLIGEGFHLKIADFDLSFTNGDGKVMSKGTKYYRAPELYTMRPPDPRFDALLMADIYSAGVILFIFKSGGIYPHLEDTVANGVNFEELMYKNNKKFWEVHCRVEGRSQAFYDRCFRELFNNMVRFNPFERLTISQIKKSKWYKEAVYNSKDFREKMEKILNH